MECAPDSVHSSHADTLIAALAPLHFEFERRNDGGLERSVGFASDAVIEIVRGGPQEVTVLLSAPPERREGARLAVYLLTLAEALGIDFAAWLSEQVWSRERSEGWTCARRFGTATVSAELVTSEAVMLTISRRQDAEPGLPEMQAATLPLGRTTWHSSRIALRLPCPNDRMRWRSHEGISRDRC